MPRAAPRPRDGPADPEVPDADPEAVARKILLRRLTDRPRSRAELAEALAKRDVPKEMATRLLDRFEEVGLVVRRKLPSTRGLDTQVRMRRLAGMLGRKGYPPGLALRIVREELGADEMPVDEPPDGV